MAKNKWIIQSGKILLWAEKGLESLSLALENLVETKSTPKKRKAIRKANEHVFIDYENIRSQKEALKQTQIDITKRQQELDSINNKDREPDHER